MVLFSLEQPKAINSHGGEKVDMSWYVPETFGASFAVGSWMLFHMQMLYLMYLFIPHLLLVAFLLKRECRAKKTIMNKQFAKITVLVFSLNVLLLVFAPFFELPLMGFSGENVLTFYLLVFIAFILVHLAIHFFAFSKLGESFSLPFKLACVMVITCLFALSAILPPSDAFVLPGFDSKVALKVVADSAVKEFQTKKQFPCEGVGEICTMEKKPRAGRTLRRKVCYFHNENRELTEKMRSCLRKIGLQSKKRDFYRICYSASKKNGVSTFRVSLQMNFRCRGEGRGFVQHGKATSLSDVKISRPEFYGHGKF